jgi:N-methylhydantoinase A
VVLHRIPPGAKLADTLEIDEEAAKAAVQTIADGLGIELTAAAEAILTIANENMHAALRVVSVERGYDPRDFGLIAFGGAGPLHANALGRLIHADPVVIPPTPGVLSAFGFLASDVQNEFARTYLRIVEETPAEHLHEQLEGLASEADEWLEREGIAKDIRAYEFFADCRYHMQDIQIPCLLELSEVQNGYAGRLREQFEASIAAVTGSTWTCRSRSPRSAASARASARSRCRETTPTDRPRATASTATSRCSSTANGTRPRSMSGRRCGPAR